MKYLQNYIEEEQTKAFDEAGAFWAFGQKQFDERKKEGVKYTDAGAGLICPVDTINKLSSTLAEIHSKGIAKDVEENGALGVILRELNNHEAFYTGNIDDTVESLSKYPFTVAEILKVFNDKKSIDDVNKCTVCDKTTCSSLKGYFCDDIPF